MQAGVYLRKPAAVVDAVGDVGEALRIKLAHVTEQVVAKYLAVQGGDAVYLKAGRKAEVCHMHAAVPDYEVAPRLFAAAEAGDQKLAPAAVYLAQDLPYPRKQALHERLRPLFERLAHNGVVRVRHGGAYDAPRLVPAETVFVHHYPHEFGDDEGRVGVVYLNDVVLCKAADIAPALDVLFDDGLSGRRYEEILLL